MRQTLRQSYVNSTTKEYDYEVLVPPTQLAGFECLRRMAMQVEQQNLIALSSTFLFHLYDILADSATSTREEFIAFCLESLQGESIPLRQRALRLLKGFMEECDKYGTGGLRSHSGLLKGEL